jgi:isopenicillin N synthase-like dioxygenase
MRSASRPHRLVTTGGGTPAPPTTSAPPPVVSLAALVDACRRDDEVARLDAACREIGFFVLVDHGLDDELDALFAASHAFYALDELTKEAVPRVDRYGFVPAASQATADAVAAGRLTGTNEYLDLGLHDEVPLDAHPDLAAAVVAYLPPVLGVADVVLRALADGLGIDQGFFAGHMTDPQCRLRLLHYPPAPLLADGTRPVTTTPHTDYGAITLLATDGVGGLEVKRARGSADSPGSGPVASRSRSPRSGAAPATVVDGDWTPVDAPAGSLVVNLGDMIARWTDHTYVSTPHRVVGTPDTHRYSIPFFVNPDPATVIETIDDCIRPGATRRYQPVTAGEFLAARIDGIDEPYVDPAEGPARPGTP